ncbi:nicotinamide riboside transporter PnuC [Robertkochia marina]|uniref:Nicotinamide riboside transporter PnuC n=1 Tax=Robertkochia marina TaxID=1227945 RepID=A0A4S3M2U2_9FLAO|nr:nicotinamide riboside transporter PnuC [Robertkochia marina]THD68999.1 nicotinamide riboside transporter PnuC [Robertkochia marina]TRZ44822.1 nicotinamide riboside transporter PnuC [Robertkochia marina]
MNHIFNLLFEPYLEVPVHLVVLEAIAVIFGFLSVIYSKRENILVYPTGIISTAIFVYILWYWGLLGDMLINGYYFVMSIYGWYVWTRKVDPDHFTPVTVTSPKEQLWSVFLFVATMGLVSLVYELFDKWDGWVSYVDVVTTAVFFVGMWLMARKKLENWIYWIIGDLISVPLYLYKGLTLTSIQYFIFTIIAVYGYLAWRQNLNKSPETLLR